MRVRHKDTCAAHACAVQTPVPCKHLYLPVSGHAIRWHPVPLQRPDCSKDGMRRLFWYDFDPVMRPLWLYQFGPPPTVPDFPPVRVVCAVHPAPALRPLWGNRTGVLAAHRGYHLHVFWLLSCSGCLSFVACCQRGWGRSAPASGMGRGCAMQASIGNWSDNRIGKEVGSHIRKIRVQIYDI